VECEFIEERRDRFVETCRDKDSPLLNLCFGNLQAFEYGLVILVRRAPRDAKGIGDLTEGVSTNHHIERSALLVRALDLILVSFTHWIYWGGVLLPRPGP
jgi:hypothetical protein